MLGSSKDDTDFPISRHPQDDGRDHSHASVWLPATETLLMMPPSAMDLLSTLDTFTPVQEVRNLLGDDFLARCASAGALETRDYRQVRLRRGAYLHRYEDGKDHRLSMPHEVLLELTSRCNFSCPYCCLGEPSSDRSQCEMTPELFDSIFDELERRPVFRLIISGGEPLLWEQHYGRLFPRLARMRALGSHLALFTNGLLIDRYFDSVAACFDKTVITLNAISEDNFKKMSGRTGRHLPRILSSITHLAQQAAVHVNTVVNSENRSELNMIVDWSATAGIKVLNLSRQFSLGRANSEHNNNLSEDDWRRAADDVVAYASQQGYAATKIDRKQSLTSNFPFGPCKVGRSYMVVNFDGTVTPCIAFKSHRIGTVGDLSLSDIWRQGDWQKYRHFNTVCPVRSQQKVVIVFSRRGS